MALFGYEGGNVKDSTAAGQERVIFAPFVHVCVQKDSRTCFSSSLGKVHEVIQNADAMRSIMFW